MTDNKKDNENNKPGRPLVGSVGKPLETAREKATVGIPMIVYSFALGFVVGAIVCALLSLVNALVHLVWVTGSEAAGVTWYPLAVCVLGGLICGLWTKYVYEAPASLQEVLGTVKQTGKYQMKSLPKGIVSFLIPLAFGGSVGPEAGLTGIIAVVCTKVGALLSRAGVRAKLSVDFSVSATLSAIFGAPFLGAVVGAEETMPDEDAYSYRRPVKVVLYTTVAFGSLAGMQIVGLLPGMSSGLPRFDTIEASGLALLWVVPCIVAGWLLGLIYYISEHSAEKLRHLFGRRVIALTVTCGIILGCVALVFPDALFSGEDQVHELAVACASGGISAVQTSISSSILGLGAVAILLGTAIAKAILTPLCLNFGWHGGHFFPMIFAGTSLGFAIAALTGADAMLCVTATTATLMGAVLRKPLAAGALLLLCFPARGILCLAISVLIGSVLPMPFATHNSEN